MKSITIKQSAHWDLVGLVGSETSNRGIIFLRLSETFFVLQDYVDTFPILGIRK